jgi:Na+/citrate or Na+/malate symporter
MKYIIVVVIGVMLTSCSQRKEYICTQYIGGDSSTIHFKGSEYEYTQFIKANNVKTLKTICH